MTLIEMLVVIAIVGLLASLLLSTLSNAKANDKQAACLNNLKQLQVAYQTYAADNGGKLIQNVPLTPPFENPNGRASWVYGDMKTLSDSTNLGLVQIGELFPYASQGGVFHCPADYSEAGGFARVRSYSINAWTGSAEMEKLEPNAGCRVFLKDNDFTATTPAGIWVVMDEHIMTLSDGWFIVTMDNSDPFERLPATRHANSYCLNFADGHAENYRLLNASSQIPETQNLAFVSTNYVASPANADWVKLMGVTTSR
jgi:prepilin-type N-terminal cleavage/methylation domain-containing protein